VAVSEMSAGQEQLRFSG